MTQAGAPAQEPVAPDPAGFVPDVIDAFAEAGKGGGLQVALVTVVAVGLAIAILLWFGRPPKGRGRLSPLRHLLAPMRGALTFTAVVVGLRILAPLVLVYLDEATAVALRRLLVVLTIVGLTWAVIRLVDGVESLLLGRFHVDVEDNLKARQVHTQARVLSRAIQVVIFVLGLGAVLMTFPMIKQVGASLLASAGIAGIAIGLAARPVLENLIAGIQIALTQPITLDDVLIVEGEWGRVEEILSTYVVVRIWDDRRLIVPLRYFIDTPFENWTRRTARLLGTIFLHCDYRADLDALRDELKRLCEGSKHWDKRVAVVQVTDTTERTMQVRALVSAADSGNLWELRVMVREGLIRYLSERDELALPRVRAEVTLSGAPEDGIRPNGEGEDSGA